jgi:hypothetical protein
VLHVEDLGLHRFLGTGGEPKAGGSSAPAKEAGAANKIADIEKVLRAFDAKATLDIDALYGDGRRYASTQSRMMLQAGKLTASIQDSQVSGGKAQANLDLDVSGTLPRLRLRLRAEQFEYGALAEAFKPNTPLEGTVELTANLALEGLKEPLLGNANGHIDLAVYPRDLQIGAADYWGTGLLHMMQRSLDSGSESRLNCAVAMFDVRNGIARSEAFFADTTRVRIIGELEVDLVTRKLSGRLSPNAKNPRLFTVSPSVGIGGTMESPQVQLTPDSLVTAPLRLFFPIHAFAFDWLNATGVPADGSAGCRQAFERARSAKKAPPSAPGNPGPS